MNSQYYIGIMSGTSMDGADAVLIRMQGTQWQAALAHAFIPFSDGLRRELLALQNTGNNELHRSMILAQQLSRLYAEAVRQLLDQTGLTPADITAIGCHGQTVRHAPEHAYSIQLADLPLLAELSGIFTIGDFRSRDLAAGGQGAPLVPAFHQALFRHPEETRVVLNIGGISNISILPPDSDAFGFDTGPGNMLMDAWVQHIWHIPYDKNGEKAAQGKLLPALLERLLDHPYFTQPYPKSTGRELFSLDWLQSRLKTAGFAKTSETNATDFSERPEDVLATLLHYTARTIYDAVQQAAPGVKNLYICGGGIRNHTLMQHLEHLFAPQTTLHSTAQLNLDPQWIEAAAFGWLAACWINRTPSNPPRATGAHKACILGTGCYA
ncbi:anhydro-N-acetylmuramic acid kinase [Neisseria lisongii]|uniref:Anhydro-N-acetylmuramic acid kinase n=1 Tax=Neisseria lisongii TaxID=2912188 RepID=A0AAW5ANP8_9NEIS|nr:anhydro-N-acetylmuramic acid kinase [Neisseria lisongii]MCF7529058.1 anhydro-N-acetylmuramic acid kinase [Neisseria lisongii]